MARLVAQEVAQYGDSSVFAATPPLESKRMLCSQWAPERSRAGRSLKPMEMHALLSRSGLSSSKLSRVADLTNFEGLLAGSCCSSPSKLAGFDCA